MKKPKFYFCDIWRVNYYFFIGWPSGEFKSYVLKQYGFDADIHEQGVGKCLEVVKNNKYGILIWIKKKNDYPSLAHECLHATNYTLCRAGWKFDVHNDEPQTYLLTNLVRKALGRI